eukprot:1154881-Pelagomonas_calceolata.AAC.1
MGCPAKGREGPRECMAMTPHTGLPKGTPRRPGLDTIVSWLSIFAREHCTRCPTSPPSMMPKLDPRGRDTPIPTCMSVLQGTTEKEKGRSRQGAAAAGAMH